jgi:hypothetical protein
MNGYAFSSHGVLPEAEAPFLSLQHAIRNLADAGRRTPCNGPDVDCWTSDSAEDRAEAAEACRFGCPVIELCARFADANQEKGHVFGGVDRTPPPRTEREAA